MGFIEKIKKENDKQKKNTPYNYCDRWCERCEHSVKDSCKLYQENFDFSLNCIANGIDPNDPEFILESERKNLKKTLKLIATIAKEENIELDFNLMNQPQLQKSLKSHPLYTNALKYAKTVKDFFTGSLAQENLPPDTINDFEVLNWYHTLLPVKIHRFLSDLYLKDPFNGTKDNGSGVALNLSDAIAQVEICLKSIDKSKKALSNIFSNHIECRYSISDMMDLLNNITKHIKIILSELDNSFK